MKLTKTIPTAAFIIALLTGGCFPDDQGLSTVSLQLSLTGLGIEDAELRVRDWQDWYDNGGPGSMVFDLGLPGRGFYLGPQLHGQSPDGELAFVGHQVEVIDDQLMVDLSVTQCTDCQFNSTIFWELSDLETTVETFTGDSEVFNLLPGSIPEFIDMDISLQPTGSIRCVPSNPDYSGEVTLAVMDVKEAVIFPGVTGLMTNQGLVLPDVPVGRQMHVLVWSLADNSYFAEPVYLDAMVPGSGAEEIVERRGLAGRPQGERALAVRQPAPRLGRLCCGPYRR